MSTLLARSSSLELDFLLEQVAQSLELTPSQYENAAGKYLAVGGWLSQPDSRLAPLRPFIYPQGSMALRTTVRPILALEYDLDLVCQMDGGGLSAMELYDLLYERLAANETYRSRLEKKNRCVRIQYTNDFHLDIIPGTPDPARPPRCILVPDRELHNWTPSNPLGFITWFHLRARGELVVAKAMVPLPPQTILEKTTLAVAAQLIKRRRDVKFNGGDLAPRSIILTTLSGHFYRGETTAAAAVLNILEQTERAIAAVAPRRLEVTNPTNEDERFSDCFTADSYSAFVAFIRSFRREMAELMEASGLSDLQRRLEEMFGAGPASAAVSAFAEEFERKRAVGLRFSATSGLVVVKDRPGATHPVSRNTFFGD